MANLGDGTGTKGGAIRVAAPVLPFDHFMVYVNDDEPNPGETRQVWAQAVDILSRGVALKQTDVVWTLYKNGGDRRRVLWRRSYARDSLWHDGRLRSRVP